MDDRDRIAQASKAKINQWVQQKNQPQKFSAWDTGMANLRSGISNIAAIPSTWKQNLADTYRLGGNSVQGVVQKIGSNAQSAINLENTVGKFRNNKPAQFITNYGGNLMNTSVNSTANIIGGFEQAGRALGDASKFNFGGASARMLNASANLVKGGAGFLAPANPFFTGFNVTASNPYTTQTIYDPKLGQTQVQSNNELGRLSAGAMRMMGGAPSVASNVKRKEDLKFNIGGEQIKIDPYMDAGSLVGFAMNPANKAISDKMKIVTDKRIASLANNTTNWLAKNGIKLTNTAVRGVMENLAQSFSDIDKVSDEELGRYFAQQAGFGAVAEVVGGGAVTGLGKVGRTIKSPVDNLLAPLGKQLRSLFTKGTKTASEAPIGKLAGYNGQIDLATADKVRTEYQSLAELDDTMRRGGRGIKVRYGYQADKLADSILTDAVDNVDSKTFRRIVKDKRSKITNALNIAPYLFEDPKSFKKYGGSDNETMFGAAAGIGMEKDENGNYQVGFDANRAVLGMGVMAGVKNPKVKQSLGKMLTKAGQSLDDVKLQKLQNKFESEKLMGKPLQGTKQLMSDIQAGKNIPETVPENKYYKSIGEILSNKKPIIDRTKLTGEQLNRSNEQLLKAGYGELGTSWRSKVVSFKQVFKDLYTDLVDRFAPIESLTNKAKKLGGNITSETDPYKQARVLMGANGMADLRFQNELKPILNELDGLGIDTQDMDLYLKSRRDINLAERGIKGSDATLAQQRLEALANKYGDVGVKMDELAQKLYDFQNRGFQELVDAGFISPESAAQIRDANVDYVPFQRVMDEVSDYLGLPTRKLQNPGKVINKIKGSERQVISPLESIIGNIYQQRAAIQKNKVATAIANLGSISPELGIRQVKEAGDNTISVWRNGQKVFYEVPNDIARTVKGLNEENMGLLLKIMSAPASIMRQGATGRNVDFMVPNMIKDQFDAAVNTKYGYTPFVDYARGLFSMIKKDDVYQKWLQSGGSQSFGELSGKKSISEAVQGVTEKKRFLSRIADWAIEGIDTVGKYSEQPTRVGAFKKALSKGASMTDAALESRDITLDFSRMGAKMKVANAIIPFLNVEVQAFDRLVRNIKNKPAQTALTMAAYGALPVTLTTLYNLTQHKEEYADIPEWEKDSNLIFIKGRNADGKVDYFKIPLGNIASQVTKPVRSAIEFMGGQNDGSLQSLAFNMLGDTLPIIQPGNSLGESAIRTLGSNTPEIIKPALEVASNRSFYKWNQKKDQPYDIVPSYMQSKPANEQVFDSTESLYKYVGGLFNTSPLKVKSLAEGYLAGFAKTPANVIEVMKSVGNNSSINPDDVPVMRRFVGQAKDQSTPSTTVTQVEKGPSFLDRLTSTKQTSAAEKTLQPAKVMLKDSSYKNAIQSEVQKDSNKFVVKDGNAYYQTPLGENRAIDVVGISQMPTSNSIEQATKRQAQFEAARKLLKSPAKDDEIIKTLNLLGVDPEDAIYSLYSNSDKEVKDAYLRQKYLEIAKSKDRGAFLQFLVDGRRVLNNKKLITDDTIDELYKAGMLTKNEKDELKDIKYTSKALKVKLTGRGKGTTLKKIKAKKIKMPKFKAIKSKTNINNRARLQKLYI